MFCAVFIRQKESSHAITTCRVLLHSPILVVSRFRNVVEFQSGKLTYSHPANTPRDFQRFTCLFRSPGAAGFGSPDPFFAMRLLLMVFENSIGFLAQFFRAVQRQARHVRACPPGCASACPRRGSARRRAFMRRLGRKGWRASLRATPMMAEVRGKAMPCEGVCSRVRRRKCFETARMASRRTVISRAQAVCLHRTPQSDGNRLISYRKRVHEDCIRRLHVVY